LRSLAFPPLSLDPTGAAGASHVALPPFLLPWACLCAFIKSFWGERTFEFNLNIHAAVQTTVRTMPPIIIPARNCWLDRCFDTVVYYSCTKPLFAWTTSSPKISRMQFSLANVGIHFMIRDSVHIKCTESTFKRSLPASHLIYASPLGFTGYIF